MTVLAGAFSQAISTCDGPVAVGSEGNVQGIQKVLHARPIETDGQHAAGSRHALLQGGAMENQARRIGERESARRIGRGHFARAVAQHAVGIDTPGLEEFHQGALDRESDGLGELAFVERRLRGLETGLAQRGPGIGAPEIVDGIDGAAEYRVGLVEIAATARPLRPLPGKHHQQPPLALLRGAHGSTFFREGIERFGEFLPVPDGEGRTRGETGAAAAEIAAKRVEVQRLRVERLPHASRAFHECIGRARRERAS